MADHPHLPLIMTSTEVAQFLRISVETVRRLARRGLLRRLPIGSLRFRREDVLAFIAK
jgi:excisionase family DNA binding protein